MNHYNFLCRESQCGLCSGWSICLRKEGIFIGQCRRPFQHSHQARSTCFSKPPWEYMERSHWSCFAAASLLFSLRMEQCKFPRLDQYHKISSLNSALWDVWRLSHSTALVSTFAIYGCWIQCSLERLPGLPSRQHSDSHRTRGDRLCLSNFHDTTEYRRHNIWPSASCREMHSKINDSVSLRYKVVNVLLYNFEKFSQ